MQLTSRGVVGHALQLLHNVDVQQLKGQEVLRSQRQCEARLTQAGFPLALEMCNTKFAQRTETPEFQKKNKTKHLKHH